MESIEQAVFTSAQTRRRDGYQVVAHSQGVTTEENAALAAWCPSHDSLIDEGAGASSINFHPLPSGRFCLSKSLAAGAEYSGRRGPRVYTQCLIVPPGVMARFANNPFALLRASRANGSLEVIESFSDPLPPIRLSGRASRFDQSRVAKTLKCHDAGLLIAIVQALVAGRNVGIPVTKRPEQFFEAILNCLPPECRSEVSFSTGLRISPRRPFRLHRLEDDEVHVRHVERRYGLSIYGTDDSREAHPSPERGWAALLHEVFLSQQFSQLKVVMDQEYPGQGLENLDEFGDQLRTSRPQPANDPEDEGCREAPCSYRAAGSRSSAERANTQPNVSEGATDSPGKRTARRADASHSRTQSAVRNAVVGDSSEVDADAPARLLGRTRPEVVRLLEVLDDLVFDAIGGNRSAFAALEAAWPDTLQKLGPDVVAESREQYIRHAVSVWRKNAEKGDTADPTVAASVLDVICLIIESA